MDSRYVQILSETSIGRILKHMEDRPFAVLTAYRYTKSEDENEANHRKLMGELKSLGIGYAKVMGGWKDAETGIKTFEPSIVAPNLAKKDAVRLMRKYEQEAIIYCEPERGVYLIFQDGKEVTIGKSITFQNLENGFTRIRGRDFAFESARFMPTGLFSGVAFKHDLTERIRAVADGADVEAIVDALLRNRR